MVQNEIALKAAEIILARVKRDYWFRKPPGHGTPVVEELSLRYYFTASQLQKKGLATPGSLHSLRDHISLGVCPRLLPEDHAAIRGLLEEIGIGPSATLGPSDVGSFLDRRFRAYESVETFFSSGKESLDLMTMHSHGAAIVPQNPIATIGNMFGLYCTGRLATVEGRFSPVERDPRIIEGQVKAVAIIADMIDHLRPLLAATRR